MNKVLEEVRNRYINLGYKVPKLSLKVVETFTHPEVQDLNPLATNKQNTIIYVDDAAYTDLKNNREAMLFYFAHEVAHAITNENHGNRNFEIAIKRYNMRYKEKTSADPEDSYNKKYLPTFYKKDCFLDKCKTNKEAEEGFKNKVYLKEEKYFMY